MSRVIHAIDDKVETSLHLAEATSTAGDEGRDIILGNKVLYNMYPEFRINLPQTLGHDDALASTVRSHRCMELSIRVRRTYLVQVREYDCSDAGPCQCLRAPRAYSAETNDRNTAAPQCGQCASAVQLRHAIEEDVVHR